MTKQNKPVAMIVLNYNDEESTILFVTKQVENKGLDLIVIVDNFSSDNSFRNLMLITCEKIKVIQTDKNGGYAFGNNYGIHYVEQNFITEVIIIANPDIDLSEETLLYSLSFLRSSTFKVGLVAPTMKLPNGHLESAWKLPKYSKMLLLAIIPIQHFVQEATRYRSRDLANEYAKIEVLAGSLLIGKLLMFEDVGYFDERTFLYGEENILSFKIKMKGYQNILLTRKSYMHFYSLSINKTISKVEEKFKIAYQSNIIYLNHYLGVSAFQLKFYSVLYEIGLFAFIKLKYVQQLLK